MPRETLEYPKNNIKFISVSVKEIAVAIILAKDIYWEEYEKIVVKIAESLLKFPWRILVFVYLFRETRATGSEA